MKQETIAERAARIRLSQNDLSRKTGIGAHSIGRILRGGGARLQNFNLLATLIEQEERELLAYLLDLHGVPDQLKRAS